MTTENKQVNSPLYAGHRYLISCEKSPVWDGGISSLLGANDPCHTSCNQPNIIKNKKNKKKVNAARYRYGLGVDNAIYATELTNLIR